MGAVAEQRAAAPSAPFTEEAFMAAVCEGKVLVVGTGLAFEAEHLLSSPLLAGVTLRVSAKVAANAWEVY